MCILFCFLWLGVHSVTCMDACCVESKSERERDAVDDRGVRVLERREAVTILIVCIVSCGCVAALVITISNLRHRVVASTFDYASNSS